MRDEKRPTYYTAHFNHVRRGEICELTGWKTGIIVARGLTTLQADLRVTQTAVLTEAGYPDVGVGVGVVSRAGFALTVAGLSCGARVCTGLVLCQSLRQG